MGILQVKSAVEPVCSLEVARFHSMVYVLHIHHLHLVQVDVEIRIREAAYPLNLLGQHRKVEFG